jgi:MFS family permease
VLAFALSLALIRNQPDPGPDRQGAATIRQTGASLAAVWRRPGTRLGFWTHFTVQFSGTVFVLTWGYPFLVSGQQLPPATASALMTLFVVAGAVCAPVIGRFVGRHPFRRSSLALLVVGATLFTWSLVLAYPGPAPLGVLVLLVVVLAVGGPGSMIGFDFARTFNPRHSVGTATGVVNVGGFVAALTTMYLVGLILDVLYQRGLSPDGLYSLSSFRWALSVQLLVLLLGTFFMLRTRRRVRALMAESGSVVPPLRQVFAREMQRRRDTRRDRRRN